MATRAIKLKLVVPRQEKRLDAARALWTTHEAINEAVAYYELLLLLMRGESYATAEGDVSGDSAREQLLGLARKAQRRNTGRRYGSDGEVVELLRRLYEAMVPSAAGKKGSAQSANAFIGPLTDPDSEGFQDVFKKLERPVPNWLTAVETDDPEALPVASAWLDTEAARQWFGDTGSPPRWVRLARKGDSTWPAAFIENRARLEEEANSGPPSIVKPLKDLGVLPLFRPFLTPRIANAEGFLSPWDRLTIRLAVAHLLSWESWCRRAAREHAERQARLDAFNESYLSGHIVDQVAALRLYEVERKAELERVALPMGDRDFLITERMTRGWNDLRKTWLKLKDRSMDALLAALGEEQTRKPGRFGDPHLFRWLARPEYHHVWADPEVDSLGLVAKLNAMERLVERSRETATMTFPDPVKHPRSMQWEPEGGSNLRTYKLENGAAGELLVTLPVLRRSGRERYEEVAIKLPLAPSNQFQDTKLYYDRKRPHVRYHASSDERMTAELASADLIFDWDHFRPRKRERLAAGDIGRAYLKLALEVEPALPEGWEGGRPKAAGHFLTATGQMSKHADAVVSGLRVLSIDLGIRAFATCSVFELRDQPPDDGLAFSIDDLGLWAVHERSFILDLPGEKQGAAGTHWREEAAAEVRRLRRTTGRYRRLRRAVGAAPGEREEHIEGLRLALAAGEAWGFEKRLLSELETGLGLPEQLWEDLVRQSLDRFRTEFGGDVSEWRSRTRPRGGRKFAGKSMWALQYLTDVRRFLQGWSLLGRASGDIRRLDRERMGRFAGNLLKHIDGLKEDRLKTGADMIIQAARGYVRGGDGTWVRAFEPCHLVLFEDLSRYRMRTDRPRRENSQLMRWAHRSVPREVEMQGQLYGVHCVDTAAAFSSRFRASTLTPGIRCHPLKVRDFADPGFRDILLRENANLELDQCKPGDLVPLAGGQVFLCLDGDGLVRLHADINAAQNLQRRFWTRYRDAFRLPATRVTIEGRDRWVPTRLGKRLLGALGGYGYLVPTGHESGSCRWKDLSRAAWRRMAGSGASGDEEGPTDPQMEELFGIEEEALERSGEVLVFFRDPSGVVLPADLWYPAGTFWSIVRTQTERRLRSSD